MLSEMLDWICIGHKLSDVLGGIWMARTSLLSWIWMDDWFRTCWMDAGHDIAASPSASIVVSTHYA
jgi:hypothetical protein